MNKINEQIPGKSIVYEDPSIIIFDKPQGLATAIGQKINLCNEVFKIFPELETVNGYRKNEGGLLNRLDNETGGLVLFARSDDAFLYYYDEMKNEKIEKIYTAVVDGIILEKSGIINYPLAHHYKNKAKMIALKNDEKHRGKPRNAITEWKQLKTFDNKSVLEVRIKKGARHQIRVHLASIGFPIVGDKLYNKNKDFYENHLLFANGIKFKSFTGKKEIEVFIKGPFL